MGRGGSRVQPLERLVEADRVHKSVYTDQEIFDRGDGQYPGKDSGVYCGHETQLQKSPATTSPCRSGASP